MALSGLYLSCNESACVVCLEQDFQTAGKPVYPLGVSHVSNGAHGAQSGLVSSWRVPTNVHLHTGVRTKGCRASLDRLHFEHFKEMGKTNDLERRGVGHGSKMTMSISQPLPEFVKR